MSKLIIVCGLAGSGKTTLARELSKKLNMVCLHKDLIKENLFELLKLSSLEDSKMIGKVAASLLLRMPEEYLKNNVDVMIESPFNFPEDYKIFSDWERNYKANIYTIICSISNEEREKRFRARERHFSHHDLARNFEHSDYDYKDIPGKQIRVETSRPVEQLVEEILKQM